MEFDFLIPEEYRGKEMSIGIEKSRLLLTISETACYLIVNALEDEEEFRGCQGDSNRQELHFYDEDGEYVCTRDLQEEIAQMI